MGSVWVAQHRALGTQVAVKFLSQELMADETLRSRFAREATAASQVKSAHAVKIYDHGVTDTNVPFIVMELLEGEDLGERIRREGKLDPTFVVPVVTQLCKALQAAHEKNVVHRDVKPENVFLTNEDGDVFVKLLDFGVAKNDSVSELTLKRSTMAGEALGTPYYMSPEQYRSSKGIDRRADLWSVGVVAYEALTGHVPFDAENLTSLAIVVNEGRFKPPSEIDSRLPTAFDAWCTKALAHDCADRFQTARELADALRTALLGETTPRPSLSDADSQRIVVTTGESDMDLSLRETAFASTGAGTKPGSRKTVRIGIAVGTIAAAGAIVFAATRFTASPAPSVGTPAPSHGASVASVAPPPASETAAFPPPAVCVVTPAPVSPSIAKSIARHDVHEVHPHATPSASHVTTASSSTSSHEQIW